jgi:glycosyltransferase involved in cell wall biosynthesis
MLSTSLKSYGWSGPLHELIARVAFRKLDAVVAISIAVEEMLREDYHIPPSRLKLIPSGISVSRLERLAAEQPSLPASELPRVVAASRIVYHKGFDTLIDAHLCAFPVIPHELIIVGDGEELSALIARGATGGSIHFTGRLANPYPLMKSATVVCVPSRWEARGIVPIESLMLGLNVIATDCPGGLAETMGHGDFGDLVPPDDPAALAEALLRCLRTPDSLAAKTRAGRQFHRDQSSVAATGRAFSVLLDELESR